jgi:predicted metalloprotease with PDZ domain
MKSLPGAALALCLMAGSAGAVTAPLMTVRIEPSAMDPTSGRGEVTVALTVPEAHIAAGAPVLSLVTMAPGMSAPEPVTDLVVRDSAGRLPLRRDRSQWIAERAARGELAVRYRLGIDNAVQVGGGPPDNPREEGDGFSAAGMMLIMQPQVSRPYRIAIHWDLSGLDPGAQAVSSFGDGDVELPAGPVDRLTDAMYMAGRLQREPPRPSGAFSAVWLGDPGFDPRPVMQWTETLYGWMSRFFRDPATPPYRVFLRYNPYNAGGGVGFPHSFLATYGPGVTGETLKHILPHEMTHTWTANGMDRWYTEGDAVYYEALQPWRAHLFTTAQFLKQVNLTAARYYTNPDIHAPNAEIEPNFWKSMWLNVLAYDRGAMYFAVLNGKIQHRSGGKRSVDDLVRKMVDRARAGKSVNETVWLGLLRQALGPQGVAIHRSMMAGGVMLPASGDFGPCFRRVRAKIRRFDLGFNARRSGRVRVIESVTPGSQAARAGLRVGDVVDYKLTTEGVFLDPSRTLMVNVTRDGKTFPITYLPRGEAVPAYQWERIPTVPDSACRY